MIPQPKTSLVGAEGDSAAARPGRGPSEVRLGAVAFIELDDRFPSAVEADLQYRVTEAGGEVIQTLERLVVAWFDSATHCARCCVKLALVGCRAGLSAGDVLIEDGLLHGLPVIEASRLKDRAKGSEILATERLVRLAELPPEAVTRLGPVRLKGIDRPVPIARLR